MVNKEFKTSVLQWGQKEQEKGIYSFSKLHIVKHSFDKLH